MRLPNRWASQFTFLAAWLTGALLLGLWFGGVSAWLAGALVLYVAHLLRNLYLLDRALEGDRRVPVFETRGLWAEMLARVEKLRTKARNRKKKYHRLLREVWDSTGALSEAGIILNREHEIMWCNPAATRLLGLDPVRDVGSRIDNLVRHPGFVAYLENPRGEGITVPSPRVPEGWLAVQLIPYGRQQRLAIVRDVTRQMTLETMRRDFVANASHEMRSPLTVIAGYLDALAEDETLDPGWQAPIGEMRRQADRMTRILKDLIELTRLESADGRAGRDFVDVPRMLEQMVGELSPGGDGPQIRLTLDSDEALLGAEPELYSVFYNLIHNAVRFTPAGGTVEVTWRAGEEGAACIVADTGIGIPRDQVARVTERFYRVDPGRSRATGGTGLGLAIVKHALQRHDGKLDIQSREGEGSTFTCRFPQARVAYRGRGAASAEQAIG